MKKPTYILLTIIILIILTSCGSENVTVTHTSLQPGTKSNEGMIKPDVTDMIGGIDYSTGKRLCFLERNRLEAETASGSDGSSYYYAVSLIKGLADERIESAVNGKLTEVAESWCADRPLPDEDLTETFSEEVISNACYGASTMITMNSSDYFSGVIARTIDFYDPENLTHTLLTYDYPLNFDLRSGEEFSLAALFCDGADYMKVINSEIIRYAKDNALSMKNFSGIPEDSTFSLSENGIIIYIDDSYEDVGLAAGSTIFIDYSAFDDTLVIERRCSSIYINEDPAGFKLLGNSKSREAASETVYFDEGDKLSARVTHTAPEGFPETLFEEADKFIGEYIPDDNAAAKLRESETDFLRLTCDIRGHYMGGYSCVDLSCSVKQDGKAPMTAVRSYIYDSAGNEVAMDKCFAEDFDVNAYVSGLLAASVTALMDDGWTIEEEIDITDIDFSPDSGTISFSTLPARMSRKVTNSDGSEQTETRKDSITASASYDEIGITNLLLIGQ